MEYSEFENIKEKIGDKITNTGRMASMEDLPFIINEEL